MRVVSRTLLLPLLVSACGCATMDTAQVLVGQQVSPLVRELGDPQRIFAASDGGQVFMWQLMTLHPTASDGYDPVRRVLRPATRVNAPTGSVSDGAHRERPATPIVGGRAPGILRTFLVWANPDGTITKTAGARPVAKRD